MERTKEIIRKGKVFERKEGKIFTNKEKHIIIAKDYSHLKANYKLICKRYRVLMNNNTILNVVKELSKKYNKKEKLILKMFEIGIKSGHNVKEIKTKIEEFKIGE